MSQTKELKSKVTYSYDQRAVLFLKEAFLREDLKEFMRLLETSPKDWTYTVIQEGSMRDLVVNVPAKKKS
jgi:hypothetical protein